MDLAIIDTFGRTDSAPKTAPRSSDDASESFAGILDTRMRQPEPARERPEPVRERERPEAPEAREIPEAKPDVTEPKSSDQSAAAKPRTKPKTEHDKADKAASADQTATHEDTEADALASTAKTRAAGIAAIIAADLQNIAGETPSNGTPTGLPVAATIVPAVTPEEAAAAQILSLLTGATAPTQPQETAAVPVATAPVQAPVETPAAGSTPTPAATTPSPTTGFAPELKAATPEALPATPTNTQPVAPAPVAMPAEVITTAPAAAALLAASAEIAQPDDAAPIDLSLEFSGDAESDDVLSAVTLATTSQPVTTRPTAGLTTAPGYAAQLAVSQDATADAPSAPATPELSKEAVLATILADKAAQATEIAGDTDEPVIAKPQDTAFATASNDPNSVRAAAQAEAAAQRGARPAALPVAEQVAVRIHKAMADGIDRITVKLNPAELGHIDIRMEIGPDGKFNAVFAADRPQTVELLQRDARELARTLQDAGLRTDAGSLSFNLRGQNQGQQNSGHLATLQEALSANGTEALADAAPLPANLYSSSNAANGRVDIRV